MSDFLSGFVGDLFLIVKSCSNKPDQVNITEIKNETQFGNGQIEKENKKCQEDLKLCEFKVDSLSKQNKDLSYKLSNARILLKRQQAQVISKTPCDTTKIEVAVLNVLANKQDSVCIDSINYLNQSVAIRDSQIAICNTNYQSLYDLQKQNILREQLLTDVLNVAYKRIVRKRIENKMLSKGLMIMTGITTTLFIKSLR